MTGVDSNGAILTSLVRLIFLIVLGCGTTAAIAQSATAVSGTQINLTFPPPPAYASVDIQRGTTSTNLATIASLGAVTSFANTGLTPAITYYYRVYAWWWGECCIEVQNLTPLMSATTWSPPTAPSGLNAVVASSTQFNLGWTDTSSSETGFKVERKAGVGGTYSQIGTAAANVTSFSDATVAAGIIYYYRVRATNSVGDSAYSSEAAAIPMLPGPPLGFSASQTGQNRVDLTWADVNTNETAYKVERKTGSGGTYSQVAAPAANSTFYVDTAGISAGNTYFYRVRVANEAGNSSYSNEVAVAVSSQSNPPGGASFPDDRTRTSAFEYHAASGLLIREIIEPDDSALCLVTEYQHDAYGNRVSSTTRNCNGTSSGGITEAAAPSGNAVFASRTSTAAFAAGSVTIGGTGYSWTAGQFPTTSANALNQSEAKEFDPRFGAVTKLTGPNGLITTWTYDGFGRKASESRSDGTTTTWTPAICGACPTHGKYSVTETSTGTPTKTAYFDSLNREIRTEVQGFDGTMIRKDTEFDALGRVARVSRPYYATGAPTWTVYAHDILGRPVMQTEANGAVTLFGYDGLTTTVTNALNQTETRVKNSQGQLIRVLRGQ